MNNTIKYKKSDVQYTSIHSVGSGEWSIEVHHLDDTVIKEFVGSNGTQTPKDDLWSEYIDWYSNLPD